MYTTKDADNELSNKSEIKEIEESEELDLAVEALLKPQRELSLGEQAELATILKDFEKNFSDKQKLVEIAQKIRADGFDLSLKIPLLHEDENIFILILVELKNSSQLLPAQASSIMALLRFCAKIAFKNRELISLIYIVIRHDAFEDRQKVALFNLFLKNAQSSTELKFSHFVENLAPNYSTELALPILVAYINRFGIDGDLVRYLGEKGIFVASIVQKIDLRELRDFSLSNVVDEYVEHITKGNLLLIEMLCQQADRLPEIQDYPFFQPILAWGFACFKQALSIEEVAKRIPNVSKVLVLCLEKNLVKFQNKEQYLDNLECMIKEIESYQLIDLMAKHEITKTFTEDEKKSYLRKLLQSPDNCHQNFKINLLRLGIYWNLLIDEISDSLGGSYLKSMHDSVIQAEEKKEQELPVVDDSLFGHIHNGFWLRGTKWEGNTFASTLGYLSKKINDFSHVPPYCRTHLDNANIIVKLLAAFNNQNNALLQQPQYAYFYAYQVAKTVKALFDKEQLIAIPAGWSDGFGSGHAVIYSIVQFEQQVYLMIFNTGDGINYHRQSYDQSTGRTQFFNSQVFLIQDLN
ncbi:MAG TPA: hypothetical protein VGU44_00035, partial [Gammaproteobacteria bacterium]|nr:hypothetical protein [Gammaproteobacteria bacterium]